MPRYDYKCDTCDCEFEVERRMSDPIGCECPKCSKFTAHILIPLQTSFILKGEGWAKDNYAKAGK